MQRKDDEPEAIKKRMIAYDKDTKPLLEYYRSRELLVEIDASQSPDAVYEELLKAMQ